MFTETRPRCAGPRYTYAVKRLLGVGIVLLFFPAAASAATVCPGLTRALSFGSTGSDVAGLQTFLATDPAIYPSALVTGYFGILTKTAVQSWQASHNVVAAGSPDTTGFGVVGPLTRAAIEQNCVIGAVPAPPSVVVALPLPAPAPSSGTVQSTSTPVQTGPSRALICTTTPRPTSFCATTWRVVTTGSCPGSWQCTTAAGLIQNETAPTFGNIIGPSSTVAGVPGNWQLTASDTQDLIVFSILWGDESQSALGQIQQIAPTFQTGNTFTHIYKNAGVYTMRGMAEDLIGNITVATTFIPVDPPPVATTTVLISPGTR